MRWTGFLVFGIFLLGLSFSRCGSDGDLIDTVAVPIAPAVTKIRVAEKYYNEKVQLKTKVFYRANEYRRTWLRKRKPEKMFTAFVEEVRESGKYGFSPGDYHIDELEDAVSKLYDDRDRTSADLANLDIRITASFFLFTTHLLEGRVRYAGAREFVWDRSKPLENDIALLLQMESASDLRKEMEALHPNDKQYEKLQDALKEYRTLADSDTLRPVPVRLSLDRGERHKAIPVIRRRLAFWNRESLRKASKSDVYDDELEDALKQFQQLHGFKPTGDLNAETVSMLNLPAQEKVDLIALNLERFRWHPRVKSENDEIVVNVPAYMLHVYRNNKEKMKMRVVLGAEFTPTPVFHDTLKYIVFSPTWMVPRSIFENEFYPKLREDPKHFSPERFRFFKDGKEIDPQEEDWTDKEFDSSKYSVIENPGDVNSLGKVKFIMPNDFSIYLHDTPADQLFIREARALSHGCIRLEKPDALAAYLLAGQKGWNEKKIEEAMNTGEPMKVDLEKTWSVYIVYRTVWVDENDLVHFRDDIYGHDKRHLAYLTRTATSGDG